jgi:uncharacterized phiE125 gp8 family phage protein
VNIGPLELVEAPSGLVRSVVECRRALKVDTTREDQEFVQWIQAATRACENEIAGHRQFLSATYDLPVSGWWDCLHLPRPPLQSVTSIKYYDADGTLTTVDSSLYLVKTPFRSLGRVYRAPDEDWPTDLQDDREFPITVRFVAGYGTGADVPATIKQAITLMVGWMHANREPAPYEMEAVRSLLNGEGYGFYG